MTRRALTAKQLAVLEFIKQYIHAQKYAPFIREIQEGCRITSYKSVVDKLLALEKKGFIERLSNKHRGILLKKREEETAPPSSAGEPPQQEVLVGQSDEPGLVQAGDVAPPAPS